MKNLSITGLLLIILDIPVLLTALNVGALPQLPVVLKVTNLPAWDRRWGLLPWHAVLAPVILIFFGAGAFFAFAAISELKSLRQHWSGYSGTRLIEFSMLSLAGLAGFCFSIFFTLLGFHLEFPYHFHLAICFAPLYLAEIAGVVVFTAYLISKYKATYSGIEKFTLFCTVLIPISLIVGNIIVSLYQFLFAYAYLGLLLPATSIYVVLLLAVTRDILEQWSSELQQKPAKDCCPTFCNMIVRCENKY